MPNNDIYSMIVNLLNWLSFGSDNQLLTVIFMIVFFFIAFVIATIARKERTSENYGSNKFFGYFMPTALLTLIYGIKIMNDNGSKDNITPIFFFVGIIVVLIISFVKGTTGERIIYPVILFAILASIRLSKYIDYYYIANINFKIIEKLYDMLSLKNILNNKILLFLFIIFMAALAFLLFNYSLSKYSMNTKYFHYGDKNSGDLLNYTVFSHVNIFSIMIIDTLNSDTAQAALIRNYMWYILSIVQIVLIIMLFSDLFARLTEKKYLMNWSLCTAGNLISHLIVFSVYRYYKGFVVSEENFNQISLLKLYRALSESGSWISGLSWVLSAVFSLVALFSAIMYISTMNDCVRIQNNEHRYNSTSSVLLIASLCIFSIISYDFILTSTNVYYPILLTLVIIPAVYFTVRAIYIIFSNSLASQKSDIKGVIFGLLLMISNLFMTAKFGTGASFVILGIFLIVYAVNVIIVKKEEQNILYSENHIKYDEKTEWVDRESIFKRFPHEYDYIIKYKKLYNKTIDNHNNYI